jgi:hypothetical protein
MKVLLGAAFLLVAVGLIVRPRCSQQTRFGCQHDTQRSRCRAVYVRGLLELSARR